jgi:hypothetical protein
MTMTTMMTPTLETLDKKLDAIMRQLKFVTTLTRADLAQGEISMAIGQDILDAVAAETTAVDSVIEYIKGLVANNVITSAEGQKILTNLADNRTKLETAITTGVTP